MLHAHRKLEPRFVEHARIGRAGAAVFAAAWRTLLWTIRPWIFWRTIKLHHPIRSLRWPVWLLLTLPVLHAIAVLFAVVLFLERFGSVANSRNWMLFRFGTVPKPVAWTWTDALLVFLAHIGRPFLEIDALSPVLPATGGATASIGAFQWTWLLGYWPSYVWIGLTVSIMFPIMLYVLPHTLSVAKVRSAHLLRAFVYSLAWVAVLAVVYDFYLLTRLFEPNFRKLPNGGRWYPTTPYAVDESYFQDHNSLIFSLIVLWLSAWWLFCVKDGLRLNRPFVVWGVLLIPVLLAALIVLSVTDWPYFMRWV